MDKIRLTTSTGSKTVDKNLLGVIGLLELIFPQRIRACYVTGSYVDRSAVDASDIDLVIVFKDVANDTDFPGSVDGGRCTMYQPINFQNKLKIFSDQWSPKIIAQMNDYHFKLVKIQGEFVWHRHPDTDEVFIILDGRMDIGFRDGNITLKSGEMVVVPKGVEHKPYAAKECSVLLIEPAGTINTGDAGGEMTAPATIWI